MKLRCEIRLLFALLFSGIPVFAPAQAKPNVPPQYQRFFYQYADRRQFYEKALNAIGQTSLPVGRSYALIAGVTQYPNFSPLDRDLKPAAVDIEKLKSYLKDQEFFDEIVVLKDGDMTLDNLNYFLQVYFPEHLKSSPHSRFLFAYSGHGYADGSTDTARGFLLTSSAISKTDPVNRVDLSLLRALLDPDIISAEKVLVLINACQSGAFLGRKPFGANPMGPGDRGAHAIMASRSSQQSLSLSSVGAGSVFFEKIFAGLDGAADISPRDGVVTYHELDTYLHSEIPYVTNGTQIPMEGDISPNGSVGEFFFLNRSRQVLAGTVKPWNPGNAMAFGDPASDILEQGRSEFRAQHLEAALRLFRQAAAAGNADAINYVGYFYDHGYGVAQDYEQARRWYEKAAAAGNTNAMNNLGLLYDYGHGVLRDYQQAHKWLEEGAAGGNADAMFDLAYIYYFGQGVAQDYQQAWQWMEKAAAAGNANAMTRLGYMCAYGQGVTQDYEQARQWFEKAAAAGNAEAMNNLGYMYEHGQGVSQDYEQARQWFEKAAAAGEAEAMNNLGYMYEHGQGVSQDYEQARRWFEKGAAAGDAEAMNNLGYMYENGQGVAQNYQQARQWYEKGAAVGNTDAMNNLGSLYRNGRGVAQNYQQARQWYEKAAAAGDQNAPKVLKQLPQ